MAKKYEKIKEYLLENIQNGTYIPDRPIPPERELAAMLGVNRMTIRRAVEELMYDGYFIRRKGSGTYLTKEKVRKDELIRREDGSCGYWRLRRARYLRMIPYAYEDIYMREDAFPQVDESFYTLGLHEMAQQKGGEPHPMRQQQVEALLCLKTTADILNVKEGSPILQIKTWFYREKDDDLMLYSRSYHPGDSYSFRTRKVSIKLKRKDDPAGLRCTCRRPAVFCAFLPAVLMPDFALAYSAAV